jgi:hypothetical protein
VKLDDYIIFDSDVATKVYGKPLLPQEQALRAGLDDAIVKKLGEARFNRLFDPGELSSHIAEPASTFLQGKCKGIVYTGKNDRRCVLVYDPTTVIPVGWKSIEDPDWNPTIEDWYPTDEKGKAEKKKKKLNWNLVDKSELRGAARRSASGEWEEEKYIPLGVIRRLEKLPPDQRVIKGDLDLRGTRITSLPQGLKVGGNLYLSRTSITSLPQGLVVGGTIYLRGTPITSLPQGLVVSGILDLSYTHITSLPQDLKVGGDLDLQGSLITSLPQGLKVGDGLFLQHTLITSLPQGLEVSGDLWLTGTPITSLPQDLVVGKSILGFKGDRFKAPPHLQRKIR